jgi:tetratricopeptide (TPR) repeat protein
VDVRKHPPSFLILLAHSIPARLGSIRQDLFRRIQHAHPADLWANLELAWELKENGRPAEAIRYYSAALALRPKNPGIYLNKGSTLLRAGEVDAAIADLQQCVALTPRYAVARAVLGAALADKRRWREALDECQQAIDLDDKLALAWVNLGRVHAGMHQYEKARAANSRAIELDPGFALAWANRGNAYLQLHDYDKALTDCSEAVRLDPKLVVGWYNRGGAYLGLRQYEQAVADCTTAVRLKPKDPWAHYNLAKALEGQGRLDESIAEYREAIRHKEDYPEAHSNLARRLVMKGEFVEALTHFRRAGELSSKIPGWPYPTAKMTRQCERLVELDAKLQRKERPAGPAERIELARMCVYKRFHYTTARFYEEAFVARPEWADDLGTGCRYKAARAAALAGCGQGKDADKLDATEYALLRGQALSWLRADLEAWGRVLNKEPDNARPAARVTQVLQDWLGDADFASVRDPEALAKLPEPERQSWQKLWNDVTDTLSRAQRKTPPEKK